MFPTLGEFAVYSLLYFGVWVYLPPAVKRALRIVTVFTCVVGLLLIFRSMGFIVGKVFVESGSALFDLLMLVPKTIIYAFTGN